MTVKRLVMFLQAHPGILYSRLSAMAWRALQKACDQDLIEGGFIRGRVFSSDRVYLRHDAADLVAPIQIKPDPWIERETFELGLSMPTATELHEEFQR